MGYKVIQPSQPLALRYLENKDYKGNWPVDSDWTWSPKRAYVFENENDAHMWVRENKHNGQFAVIDSEGNEISDSRGEDEETFDSAVKRYIDTTGDSYPGQSDWRRG